MRVLRLALGALLIGGCAITPVPQTLESSTRPIHVSPSGKSPTGPTESAIVLSVTDGDTIRIDRGRGSEPLRYIGVDTPESTSPGGQLEWMALEASAANEKLVAGREVVLEKDVSETDRFGRLLRYVWIRDADTWLLVELELVRLGFATVSTFPPDVKYVDDYLAAENEARQAGRGLWGKPPTAATAPPPAWSPLPFVGNTGGCEPSYPGLCVPLSPPDLDCKWIYAQGIDHIVVLAPDPHRFDGNHDGVGCESP